MEGKDKGKKIEEWERIGIKRENGKKLKEREMKGEGYIIMNEGS